MHKVKIFDNKESIDVTVCDCRTKHGKSGLILRKGLENVFNSTARSLEHFLSIIKGQLIGTNRLDLVAEKSPISLLNCVHSLALAKILLQYPSAKISNMKPLLLRREAEQIHVNPENRISLNIAMGLKSPLQKEGEEDDKISERRVSAFLPSSENVAMSEDGKCSYACIISVCILS
jgi:hypothetical protein